LSGESYPQYCLNCETEWKLLGDLNDEESNCPECRHKARVVTFFKWWVITNIDTTISVEFDVPSELSAAVDEIARVSDESRRREMIDLISFKPVFVEDGDRSE